MNTIQSIAQFISDNREAFIVGGAWFIREWKTFGGFTGIKHWFMTGKISQEVPQPQPQQQNKQ